MRPVLDESGAVQGVLGLSIDVEGDDLDRVDAAAILRGGMRAARRLARSPGLEPVLESAVADVGRASRAGRALLVEHEGRHDATVLHAAWVHHELHRHDLMPPLAGVIRDPAVSDAMRAGRTRSLHVDDMEPLIGTVLAGWGVREVICVPILVRGAWWGALVLAYERAGTLGTRSLASLESAASVFAAAIDLGDLTERIARNIDARSLPSAVTAPDLARVRSSLENAAALARRLEEIAGLRASTTAAAGGPATSGHPPGTR